MKLTRFGKRGVFNGQAVEHLSGKMGWREGKKGVSVLNYNGVVSQTTKNVRDVLLGAMVAPLTVQPVRYYAEIAGCAGVWGIGPTPADTLNDLQSALEEWTIFRRSAKASSGGAYQDFSEWRDMSGKIREVWPDEWIRQLRQNGFDGPFPVFAQSFMRKDHLIVRVPPENVGPVLRPILAEQIARQTGVLAPVWDEG